MKATISGVDLFFLAYAWSNKRAVYLVSTCGTTVQHEIPYHSNFTDDFGNVTFKEIPRPSIAHFYFELCPLIDNHNKDRQGILGLEDCWPTKNPWFRLFTRTMIGMSVVDLHRWDRNKRSDSQAFDWVTVDDERPDFLRVRSMANLIARGLHKPHMRTTMQTNRSQQFLSVGQRRMQQRQLSRISNAEGETKQPSKQIGQKPREFQQTCFICCQYHYHGPASQWWCSKCHMPLCSNSTPRREITCYKEHCANQGDPVLGCCARDCFFLPKEYRLYRPIVVTTATRHPHCNLPHRTIPSINNGGYEFIDGGSRQYWQSV